MKILMVNVVCGIRSTGRICTDLATVLEKRGHEVKIAYGRESVPKEFQKYAVRIGNETDVKFHGMKARLFDGAGFGSVESTKKFIDWVRQYDPDVIHLHNIHGYYINVKILFDYLKTCGKKIIWTLHDCWSFTGHCTYFEYINCNKWKGGCKSCRQKSEYPARIGPDFSKRNYRIKKKIFTQIPNMILVTPSDWLKKLVGQSFMKEYRVQVIHNGVDTTVFKPRINDIHEKYHCHNKKIVLGVAAIWDRRKGLSTFIELAKYLSDAYQIILIGLSKDQIKQLPSNIIGIEKTDSVKELTEFYTAANVFVNPTLEDNYPTTNLEAIACGTPVITYKTGGSIESAKMYGKVVEKGNIEEIIEAIKTIDDVKGNSINIDYRNTIEKYISLYEKIK